MSVSPRSTAARSPHIARAGWIGGTLTLGVLIAVVLFNFSRTWRFLVLLTEAEPVWLGVAVLLQIGTYVAAGAVLRSASRKNTHVLTVTAVSRLALEKMSVSQLLPTGGMTGNLVVTRALGGMGVSATAAMETVLVDIFSYYAAYATAALTMLGLLLFFHQATAVILWLVAGLTIMLAILPFLIFWLLEHRKWQAPRWIRRRYGAAYLLNAIAKIRPSHVLSPRLLGKAWILHTSVFVLDSATLWAVMLAIGSPIGPLTAFMALMLGAIAATFSLIPGGVGSFEAACTAALVLMGTPIEVALTGTLILRGLTLWLPLLPGIVLARDHMNFAAILDEK